MEVLRAADHDVATGVYPDMAMRAGSARPARGPPFLDEGGTGPENEFTNRSTTIMTGI